MIAEQELDFTPAGSWLRIRVTPPVERTSGGLWYPEVSQRRPPEGTVVAVGLGRAIPGSDLRAVIWPGLGDVVVYDPTTFVEISDAFDGLVSAEDVIAVIDPQTEEVTPENDFLSILPDERESETAGGILRPETYRKAAKSGVILDAGPGEIRLFGPLTGVRRKTHAILGLTEGEPLAGRRVWWEGKMKSFHLGGKHPCVLVHAGDLMLID